MLSSSAKKLLGACPRAISHLSYAKREKRLGLILGSGVSDALDLPKWEQLLDRIQHNLGYKPPGTPPPSYRAEQLFQYFRAVTTKDLGMRDRDKIEAAISVGWRTVVANALYQTYLNADGRLDEERFVQKIRQHPYLIALGRLAQSMQLVVTHNFDDALERSIEIDASTDVPTKRRYHSFWRPEPFLRRPMVNIYHPNGFSPIAASAKASDSLILTEASFADHLADTNTPEAHFLIRYLAEKTWLIIGHSLADGTLKNALRLHANQRPGHVNYFVHWVGENDPPLEEQQKNAIREANFGTYNLVTIFATSQDIRDLADVISMEETDLEGEFQKENIPSRYVYYIAGAVSSGKSTILGNVRDLITVEEWPRRMPPAMNKQSTSLSQTEQAKIDEELEEAIWNKNKEAKKVQVGIVAIDRAPLDYLAFPSAADEAMEETAKKRTQSVLGRLLRGDFKELLEGQVILVRSSVSELVERQLKRGGRTTPDDVKSGKTEEYLKRQQKLLDEVYRAAIECGSVVDSGHCSIARSAKDAARLIHFGEYKCFDFSARLKEAMAPKDLRTDA